MEIIERNDSTFVSRCETLERDGVDDRGNRDLRPRSCSGPRGADARGARLRRRARGRAGRSPPRLACRKTGALAAAARRRAPELPRRDPQYARVRVALPAATGGRAAPVSG